MVWSRGTTMKDIRYIVGKGSPYGTSPDGWVTVDLDNDRGTNGWGCALAILGQHGALTEISLLTEQDWLKHEASSHCAISHIDFGLEVLH